jgi:hypothetical protein
MKQLNETVVLATCGIRPPDGALRTPNHVSGSLPIPKRKSKIASIQLLIFTKG